ncbi:Uncharacterized protein APZ42_003304 [Daphnia magna]|uniref:Uncharacterized protein n=1 Tax=Daphnia magna TaxID=35525 RepID=A0A164HMM4_9CRUS|nr:Uncharacterized protein APZ42_003304 [Daphnia magna]
MMQCVRSRPRIECFRRLLLTSVMSKRQCFVFAYIGNLIRSLPDLKYCVMLF